jgi:hypothetical protein
VDQAALANQGLLWHQRECSEDQIWIAVSVYVLVAIIRKRLRLEASLSQILQILSVTLFEKTPILQALQASTSDLELLHSGNQLILFDFSRTAMITALRRVVLVMKGGKVYKNQPQIEKGK